MPEKKKTDNKPAATPERRPASRPKVQGAPAVASCNEVLLHGRVRREPVARGLPSGDRLVTLRLVVPRPADGPGPRSDWVDCVVWHPRLQARLVRWCEGDEVEVRGALRRRFFRGGVGTDTRLEVEVLGGKLLRRARADATQS